MTDAGPRGVEMGDAPSSGWPRRWLRPSLRALALSAIVAGSLNFLQRDPFFLGPLCLVICRILGGPRYYIHRTFVRVFGPYLAVQFVVVGLLSFAVFFAFEPRESPRGKAPKVLSVALWVAYVALSIFPPAAAIFLG